MKATDKGIGHNSILANMVSLGTDLWKEVDSPSVLRFDDDVYEDYVQSMVKHGYNMMLLDVAEGLRYPSHPEIAVKGAWSPERLNAEVKRLRKLGIELVPKLNFSATHDNWLGDYARMVSTPLYRQVCADLIRDVYEICDQPRLIHLGMDEEVEVWQKNLQLQTIRRGELWWYDFLKNVKVVEDLGAQAWVWSCRLWYHKNEFLSHMPKSVLQMSAVYGPDICTHRKLVKGYECNMWDAFEVLDKAGYDQVACGSNWECDVNPKQIRKSLEQDGIVKSEHFKGYLMAPWYYTIPDNTKVKHYTRCMNGIRLGAEAWK